MISNLFSQLLATIRAFDDRSALSGSVLQDLLLGNEGPLNCFYAPFDHIPQTARLAIVGITPGRAQAEIALRAAGAALRAGRSNHEAARLAKLTASFGGRQTRNNLVAMLDIIGLAAHYGLSTCADLFDPAHEPVHFTSALRYPVFVHGKNYNGAPNMLHSKLLRMMIETHLAAEVAALPNALWLPLGPKPNAALQHLVRLGALSPTRVLDGMPHPSGLNGERVAAFLGRIERGSASIKTNVDRLVSARSALIHRVNGFAAEGLR